MTSLQIPVQQPPRVTVPGALKATGVPLPSTPPYINAPSLLQPPAAPQVLPGAAINGSGAGQYPTAAPRATFTPNIITGACIGQIGPYAVVEPFTGNQARATIVLPASVVNLLGAYPAVRQATVLMDSLLSRIPNWSATGCQTCGTIARALSLFMGSLQAMVLASDTNGIDPDVAVFLWNLRGTLRGQWLLLYNRAQEASGPSNPALSAAASTVLSTVLALPLGTLPDLSTLPVLVGGVSVT